MRFNFRSTQDYIEIVPFTYIAILLSVFALLLTSCEPDIEPKKASAYIGGEIVNPNNNYVIVSKDNSNNDTIYLDENNRFLHTLDSAHTGFYIFKHSPETQLVHIERGDSILLRLNTLQFDESLVFSGRGAERNNFIVDMFLANEYNQALLPNWYKLPPKEFEKKMDSLENRYKKQLKRVVKTTTFSKTAIAAARNSYMYNIFSYKENYPANWIRTVLNSRPKKKERLPETYYAYRKKVNFNDSTLRLSYAYNRFIYSFIQNETLEYELNNDTTLSPKASVQFKLALVDSVIPDERIKNTQMRGITRQYILTNRDSISSYAVLDDFLTRNTNPRFNSELTRLAKAMAKLENGDKIPNEMLVSSSNENSRIGLQELSQKAPLSVFYFWSVQRLEHFKEAHNKAETLRKKYPSISVYGINTNDDKTKKWIPVLNQYNYSPLFEFQFDNYLKSRRSLVLTNNNKTIITNRNGEILTYGSNLLNPNFEREIQQYLNRISDQEAIVSRE